MTSKPLRVLCLDIEGGYGGSSRSLWEALRHIDKSRIEPVVWCRKPGPAQTRYQKANIDTFVKTDMPTVSALPKFSRNVLVFSRFFLKDWRRSQAFRDTLLETLGSQFDLLHCNHESLSFLANWLHSRLRIPITFHIRTNLWDSVFARQQVRILRQAADGIVFITENEQRNFERLLGAETRGRVIFNAASVPEKQPEKLQPFDQDNRYKIACLSSFSWSRGIDRLVEIAEALAAKGRRDVLFIVAGNMQLPRSLPGPLGQIAREGGSLADYAAQRGVTEMFAFLGHVENPESVLSSSDALIKPTREANPWGRDIIEALAMARPVITLGSWDGFVRQGETGILHSTYDAEKLAAEISALSDDRAKSCIMGKNGQQRISDLCNPSDRATDLADFWHDVALSRSA